MLSLQSVLARLGAQELCSMLGASVVELLEALDFRNLAPGRLAELVIHQAGPEGLLLSPPTRGKVLDALPRGEAESLARLLRVDPGADPWGALRSVAFRRGSASSETLFSFLGCAAPLDESEGALQPDAKVVRTPYPLFEHQRSAARDVLGYITHGRPRRALLHMPTGAGKTRTAMNVVSEFLRRVQLEDVLIWVAHTEELCEQAAEEFEAAWTHLGDREVVLFRHFGPHRADLEQVRGGVLVAGLSLLYRDSLTHQSEFLSLARRTRLVIMDEAHQAVAPTYKHLLDLLASDERTAVLGLSATPGRSLLDAAEDMRLASFFARQKITLQVRGYANPVEFLQSEGYLARVEYVSLPHDPAMALTDNERLELERSFELPRRIVETLASDHQRNLLILTRTMQEANRGGKIILFGCSVAHANLLSNLLRMKGYAAETVTAETRADRRRDIISRYRDTDHVQILSNYGVLTMGFDAPKTNVAVIARPTQSVVLYSQMVGRAMRGPRAGGNVTCRVLTVVDRIPGFRSVAEAFGHWEDIWTDMPEPKGEGEI